MLRIIRGFGAGFVATVVLSLLFLCKSHAGVLSDFDMIPAIAKIFGAPEPYGWIGHFAVGVFLWGGLFGLLHERLPPIGGAGNGIAFGIAIWVLTMVIFTPVAGFGFLFLALGPSMAVPMAMAYLILFLIYGFVLGAVYDAPAIIDALRPPEPEQG
jgi:hypothetical protein